MKHTSILSVFLMSAFLLTACGNEENHPAHDMGERADRVNKENSPDYQTSREKASDSDSMSHPAYEMDEVEAIEKRGN